MIKITFSKWRLNPKNMNTRHKAIAKSCLVYRVSKRLELFTADDQPAVLVKTKMWVNYLFCLAFEHLFLIFICYGHLGIWNSTMWTREHNINQLNFHSISNMYRSNSLTTCMHYISHCIFLLYYKFIHEMFLFVWFCFDSKEIHVK